MGEHYEVVKARSWEEAVAKCGWKVGGLGEVVEIVAIANADGTYTVYPVFEHREIERDIYGAPRIVG